jgi:hypothetical protein
MSNFLLEKLDQRINDETLSPALRESASAFRDKVIQIYEKREVMQHCPALCLMELARATEKDSERALEVAFRYIPRIFWQKEAFCREAVKINAESLDYVPARWKESCR